MKFVTLVLILASSAFADGEGNRKDMISLGGKEGHGGDSVRCEGSKKNAYSGTYVLDYIIANERNSKNLRNLGSAEKELQTIQTELDHKTPQLSESFKQFMAEYEKSIVSGQKRTDTHYWQAEPNGLLEIYDENLQVKLPENCQTIYQTVNWKKRDDQFVYKYDPRFWSQLSLNGQLSWILVHEWLRGFMTDADAIRDVNEYLHSTDFVEDNENEVSQTLYVLQMGNYKTRTTVNKEASLIKYGRGIVAKAKKVLESSCTEETLGQGREALSKLTDLNTSDEFYDVLFLMRLPNLELQYTLLIRMNGCARDLEEAKQKAARLQ